MLVGVAGACRDAPTGLDAQHSLVRAEWVTGEARAALGPDGRFVFPRPAYAYTSPERADSVAEGYVRFLPQLYGAVSTDSLLVQDRGGFPIHFGELRRCGRSLYVRSAVAPLPAAVALDFRYYYGGQYAVPFCNGAGAAELNVDVADGPPRVVVGPDGTLVPPWSNGNEFTFWALRASEDAGLPTSPEAAVAFAAQATGRRVARLPEALPNFPNGLLIGSYPSMCMRWHLVLDAPVALVRHSGATDTTADVYVSRSPCNPGPITLYVATRAQPTTSVLRYYRPAADPTQPATPDSVVATAVVPVAFEGATVAH